MDSSISIASSQNQSSVQEGLTPHERADFHLDRARHLIVIGSSTSIELERAVVEVSKALSFITDDGKYYMFMAKLYKLSLDTSSAIFCYRFALKLDSNNEMALKFLGDMLLMRGKELMITGAATDSSFKYQLAKHCFEEFLDRNKDNSEAWFLKAVCHVKIKEYNLALDCVSRAIKSTLTASAEMYILRAKLLWAKGLIEQGNADIRIASSLDPDHVEVISFCQRSYKKAERLYKLCVAEFTKGNYPAALNACRFALSITTEDVKLHIMVAKIHRVMGELQPAYAAILQAQEIFERASANSFTIDLPGDIIRQMNLILNEVAIKYASEGDYEKAILLLNRIIKIEKDIAHGGLLVVDYRYYLNRGDCYRALSQMSDAIYDYEQALELDSESWEIRTRLSLTHYLNAVDFYNNSKYRLAERQLDSAINYNPKVAGYYALRGKSSYYTGDLQKSFKDFQKSLELDGSNEEIRTRLAQFEAVANNNEGIDGDLPDFFGRRRPAHVARVTSDDLVDMMLHPKHAMKLPTIKLKNFKDIEADDTTKLLKIQSGSSSNSKPRNEGKTKAIKSPRVFSSSSGDPFVDLNVSPHFSQAFKASSTVQAKVRKLHKVFDKRTVHPKTGNDLWSVMATAGKMAFERSHPNGYESKDPPKK